MRGILLVTLLFLLPFNLSSQERRLALVIGNGNYRAGILANPENDARSIEKTLREIGFEVLKYENLKQSEMVKAIDDFGKRLPKYDVGLFFYAGHGIQSKGFNYLIPVDAAIKTESDVEYNCVRADRVLGKMEGAKTKVNLVILDACRNNPYERSWTRSSSGNGLASMNGPVGSIIAFATSPGNTADDGPGNNGLYTSGLLRCLNEPGITVTQMLQKVNAFVLKRSNGRQQPWFNSNFTADFYLVPKSDKADNAEVLATLPTSNKAINNEKTLVIVPFKNLTGNPDNDYLVKAQEICLSTGLANLSVIKPIRILTGSTGQRFSNPEISVPELANEINIDFLIEGSVINAKDSFMIQLSMKETYPKERLVWAQIYTSDITSIYRLYSNIAGQIVNKIGFEITPEAKAKFPVPPKVNPETFKAYERGKFYLNKLTPESIEKGFTYLNQAVELDPADPYALTNLALGYLNIAHSALDPGDALMKAEAAAFLSLKFDTTIAETYSALGQLYLYSLWKFNESEKNFKKALELNPNSDNTHYHYAWLLFLLGRLDEAIEQHKLAQKYDPFNPQNTGYLGWLYSEAGKYEDAIREAQKAMKMQQDYDVSYLVLGKTYMKMGRKEEAIAMYKKVAELYPWWSYNLGVAFAETGNVSESQKILEAIEKEPVDPWNAFCRAVMNAALGKRDEAFKWINYEPHHAFTAWIITFPEFNSLHNDPRWDQFLKRLNLPNNK